MARKKDQFPQVLKIASVLAALVLLSGAGVFLAVRSPNGISKLPDFPIDQYLEGTGLWSHENYKITGRVDNVLLRSAKSQRLLISIKPDGFSTFLPVLLENGNGKIPVQREQKLVLEVHLGPDREILCTAYGPQ
jgi:hypothetical protein